MAPTKAKGRRANTQTSRRSPSWTGVGTWRWFHFASLRDTRVYLVFGR